jgi:hypothetical protein
MSRLWPIAAASVLLLSTPLHALDLRAQLEGELRGFRLDSGSEFSQSLAGTVELFHAFPGTGLRFESELFYRLDADDDRRTRGDIREAYFHGIGRDLELAVGYRRVFWGVTESRSLVDVINQDDLIEDIGGDDKLGQPMFNLTWISDYGTGNLYLLAGTRKRTFPGPDGFPRIPFEIDQGASRFDGELGQSRLDLAARWFISGRGFDLGFSYFDGIARDPNFLPCLRQGSAFPGTENGPNCDLAAAIPEAPNLPPALLNLLRLLQLAPSETEIEAEVTQRVLENLVLVPEYPRSRQFGIDAQYVTGGLALRFEGLSRERAGRHSLAAVAGLEYTLPRFFETGWDVGVLTEYLYDQRREDPLTRRFSDDLFFGLRLFANDLASTTVLAGTIVDRDFSDRLFSIEASRRLGADWRLTLDLRLFSDQPDDPLAEFLQGQDYARLRLVRFF